MYIRLSKTANLARLVTLSSPYVKLKIHVHRSPSPVQSRVSLCHTKRCQATHASHKDLLDHSHKRQSGLSFTPACQHTSRSRRHCLPCSSIYRLCTTSPTFPLSKNHPPEVIPQRSLQSTRSINRERKAPPTTACGNRVLSGERGGLRLPQLVKTLRHTAWKGRVRKLLLMVLSILFWRFSYFRGFFEWTFPGFYFSGGTYLLSLLKGFVRTAIL